MSATHRARLGVAVAVLLVYWPVLTHDFGGWDDDMNIVANPDLKPPTLASIARYWRRPAFDLYAPVTFTIWGALTAFTAQPWIFHTTNLLAHITAAILVFELLRRLDFAPVGSLLGALIFGLHPLAVESVAWVSGLKDVLAGMLGLLALVIYLDAPRTRGRLVLASFVLVSAMLAKSSAVVIAPIALLLDLYMRPREWRQCLVRSIPLLAVTIPLAIVAKLSQPALQIQTLPIASRILISLDSLAFYLWKLIWPVSLCVDYGRTPPLVLARGWMSFTWLVPIVLIALAMILRRLKQAGPSGRVLRSLLIFMIALAPTLGLIPFDFQAYSTVADHYAYLALLAPALLVASFTGRTAYIVVVVICCVFAALSFRQSWTWRDGASISRHALAVNPRSWASHGYLANIYFHTNHPRNATEQARLALELNPNYLKMAHLLSELGEYELAIPAYRRAVEDRPDDVVSLANLAAAHAELRQFDEAIRCYDRALSIDPNFAAARFGRERAIRDKARSP